MTDPIPARVAALKTMPMPELKAQWRELFDTEPPPFNRRHLENRIAYRIQELAYGGLKPETIRRLEILGEQYDSDNVTTRRIRHDAKPVAGTRLVREYQGVEHTVTVLGRRLRVGGPAVPLALRHRPRDHRHPLERPGLLRHQAAGERGMTKPITRKLRCAVYTRKSTEEGLEQEFNSLHAQREACEAYVASQRSEGWALIREPYDDGGFSGGTLERPALKRLLADIEEGLVDVVVVYKIDRLSRSLMDFSKLVEVFDRAGVTFVSVTQSFNTTTSMGRLTLNILLSLRPVRARGHRRAHPRQDQGVAAEGHVHGRQRAARLRGEGPEAGGARGRRRDRALDLRAVRPDRLGDGAGAGAAAGRRAHQARQARRQGLPLQAAEQPDLPRASRCTRARRTRASTRRSSIRTCGTRCTRSSPRTPAPGRRDTRAQTPALLKGLIFGPTGAAMSPTHTRKGNRLYRYYVSQDVLKRGPDACPVGRVPAAEIEAAVIDQLRGIFRQPEIIVGTWRAARAEQDDITEDEAREALLQLDPLWDELFPAEQARIVQLLVERVDVRMHGVEVRLRPNGLAGLVREVAGSRRAAA